VKIPRVLIVDDEPDLRELLSITLRRMSMETIQADSLSDAKSKIDDAYFDLCLTDLCLPDGNGIELITYIQEHKPEIPVAVITAHASIDTAIQALKNGAFDFVMKPVDINLLRTLVQSAVKLKDIEKRKQNQIDELVGQSEVMQLLRVKIARLARSQAPIYISGASGVGKELVARLLHNSGPRADKPFIPVNCGAISRELMESEFFGHCKGSFTGAVRDKVGFFQAAHEGTLFLDEVAELPLDMQVKLLRAIQEKSVRPVGSATETPVDVRILSATHKDLKKLVQDRSFREDLFYRINVIEIAVPPLKERKEDIPLLAEHIIEKLSGKMGIKKPLLQTESLIRLKNYDFPGNVRELENILERAMTLCENGVITPSDLQLSVFSELPTLPSGTEKEPEGRMAPFNWSEENLEDYLDKIAKEAILKALAESRGNKTLAAKLLGISLRTLRYRLKKLRL